MGDDQNTQDPQGGVANDPMNGNTDDADAPVTPAEGPVETPATEEGVETPPTTGETPVEGNPEEAPVNGDNSGMAQ